MNNLKKIKKLKKINLNLGCGKNNTDPDYVGIDIDPSSNADYIGDALKLLKKLNKNSVNKVYSSHFFEHIDELENYLIEIQRVLKNGGILEIIVPHFSNSYYYSDYTHKKFFGLYSFSYFSEDKFFKRRVPTYNKKINFKIENVKLIFKSPRPFYFRYLIRKFFEKIFNLNKYTQEFYEENCSSFLSCYELRFILSKR